MESQKKLNPLFLFVGLVTFSLLLQTVNALCWERLNTNSGYLEMVPVPGEPDQVFLIQFQFSFALFSPSPNSVAMDASKFGVTPPGLVLLFVEPPSLIFPIW
jgi:hypothetical protein